MRTAVASQKSLLGSIPEIFRRIAASLHSKDLVGPLEEETRYLRYRWFTVFWRLSFLALIPVLALANPDYFLSLPRALGLLALALAYTGVHTYLVWKTGLKGKWPLWAVDLLVSIVLMLAARDAQLMQIFAFYALGAFTPGLGDTVRVGAPAIALLTGSFFLAEKASGYGLGMVFSHHPCVFPCFFTWAVGITLYSLMFNRVGNLNLEKHLEEERRDYRRRLHDDLGNTLCGLHYKIRGLAAVQNLPDQAEAFRYLENGYGRANEVLSGLVEGLEEPIESEDVNRSLVRLKQQLECDFNVVIDLFLPGESPQLSVGIQREALAVVREAIANAVDHAGARRVAVFASQKRGRVSLAIENEGEAFSQGQLQARQTEGGSGIRNMRERARLIHARLRIDSQPGRGTRVSLSMRAPARGNAIGSKMENDPRRDSNHLRHLVSLLKGSILVLVLAVTAMLPASERNTWAVLVITAVLVIDGLAWVIFVKPITAALIRHPQLLLIEFSALASLFLIAAHAGLDPYFCCASAMAIVTPAAMLSFRGILPSVIMLDAVILFAVRLGPHDMMMSNMRLGEAIFLSWLNLVLALSAGLSGRLLDGVEELQLAAVRRELMREKERLSAHTHRQLHEVVEKLGGDIRRVLSQHRTRLVDLGTVRLLAGRSSEIKQKLRTILHELDDYSCCPFPQDIRTPLPECECWNDPSRPVPAIIKDLSN